MTTLRLLIVDDNPDDARLIAHKLKRAGYAVEWERVDDEAAFARAVTTADLVICDFAMPRFSPQRALELLGEYGLATPLILVSGSVSVDTAHQLMARGAVSYLLKDKLEHLGQAVGDALARRAH